MKYCGGCGTPLEDGVVRCYQCGKNVCLNCGTVMVLGRKKCPRCGSKSFLDYAESIGCLIAIGVVVIFILLIILL